MSEPSARNFELEASAFVEGDLDSQRVYADWLQSVGDPRGELASLELHRQEGFRSQRRALEQQIREREQPFRDRWHEWAQARDLLDVRPRFKRGFVVELEGPLSQLRDRLGELFERDPIQRLTLREVDGRTLMQLCERHPAWFGRLRYLRLAGELGPLGAAALAEVSLHALERLNLLSTGLDAEACGHLARLDTKNLRSLALTDNHIDAQGLARLLESETRGQWRELYLARNPLGSAGLERLAATTGLERLEGLYLRRIDVKFSEHAALLDSPNFPGLRKVELSSHGSWGARQLRDRMRERWGAGLVLQ